MENKLLEDFKEALSVPIPSKDHFWETNGKSLNDKNHNRLLGGIFKKKDICIEKIDELRKAVIQTPGCTRSTIDRLKKRHPNNPALFMLSAMCSYGMLKNSLHHKEVLSSLRIATKEAAISLNHRLSVYNAEYFFKIYFAFLEKLKRQQIQLVGSTSHQSRDRLPINDLVLSAQLVDQLLSERPKIIQIMERLKKTMLSSQYTNPIEQNQIKLAVSLVLKGKSAEKNPAGTAGKTVFHAYILALMFARVPILSNLVSDILSLFPDDKIMFRLRRISVRSVRNISRFKLAAIEGKRTQMISLGKALVEENLKGAASLGGKPLQQTYEMDPFFNLAISAHLTQGLFGKEIDGRITDVALEAMGTVLKRDISRNSTFTKLASEYTHKLSALRDSLYETH